MRGSIVVVLCLFVYPHSTSAEVTGVTVTSRTPVAGGQSFGVTGPYERLVGRIEFALDPDDPHNAGIVDLSYARREADGRVHFSSDLSVLRPTDPAKGNGVLLFEVVNRGRRTLLGRFNRAEPSTDPTTAADVGDGLLMRDGFTLVWIGWEIDVPAPLLRIEAPIEPLRRYCRPVRPIRSGLVMMGGFGLFGSTGTGWLGTVSKRFDSWPARSPEKPKSPNMVTVELTTR